MAGRNNKNGNMNIISSKEIVCQETSIHITDEKLKNSLSKTYEIARKDANRFKVYKVYNIFFSISGTLFLSLITSDFKNFPLVSSQTLGVIGLVACVGSFLIGVVLLLVNGSFKHSKETEERDKAIQQILKEVIKD